ncbi:hypothetical protein C8Q74DRAFT_1451969 [Fomes fomentarius]|nr:hypothetical protein C8Q74DRAFT_1451969 [Fomes fomentarius]
MQPSKLQGLGYAESDFPVNSAEWDKFLNRPRELTERIWKIALPKLKALIEQERADRIRAAFEARLNERHAEVQPYYANFVRRVHTDIRPFMPNLFSARHMPSLLVLNSANDAQTRVTLRRFSHRSSTRCS